MVTITRITLDFSGRTGDATLLESLRARLIQDTNANGRFDTGEAILATQAVQNIAAGLTLDLTPPRAIARETTRHLLVTLDINNSTGATRTNLASRASVHRMSLASLGGFVLLFPGLSMVLVSRWPSRGSLTIMLYLVLQSAANGLPDDGNGDGEDRAELLTAGLRAGSQAEQQRQRHSQPRPLTARQLSSGSGLHGK
jgi:hypothetical protein